MKFVNKLIIVSLILNILIIIQSFEMNLNRRGKSKTKKVSNHKTRNDDNDCGCKITLAYFAPYKKRSTKPYKARWPKKASIPEVKVPVVTPTCDPDDGGSLLGELRQLFPPPIGKRKAAAISSEGGVVTKTISISSSSSPPTGKFTVQILDLAKSFRTKIKTDEKSPYTRRKKIKGKKKKTPEEIEKEISDKRKNSFLRISRKMCNRSIRTFLDPGFKTPYKESKCWAIGRILKRCFVLA